MATTYTTEELLSGQLDSELTARERQQLQEALERDQELRGVERELTDLNSLFSQYKETTAQDVPAERFWEELSPRLNEAPEPAGRGVSNTEILKLLSAHMKKPSLWERLLTGAFPAMVGAAAAVAVVFFFVGPQKRPKTARQTPQRGVATNAPAPPAKEMLLVKRSMTPPPAVAVSTNPKIKPSAVVPNPAVASIVAQTESCTIESMNAEDDTITTVFKVADKDGSMITVIWLPVEDEGTSI